MKVLLKRTWFCESRRFRPSVPADHPVEIPDQLRDKLPSDAVVVADAYKPPSVEPLPEPETLSELGKAMKSKSVAEELADAQIGADAEAAGKSEAQAEQDRADAAKQFQLDLDAENATLPKRGPGRPRKNP